MSGFLSHFLPRWSVVTPSTAMSLSIAGLTLSSAFVSVRAPLSASVRSWHRCPRAGHRPHPGCLPFAGVHRDTSSEKVDFIPSRESLFTDSITGHHPCERHDTDQPDLNKFKINHLDKPPLLSLVQDCGDGIRVLNPEPRDTPQQHHPGAKPATPPADWKSAPGIGRRSGLEPASIAIRQSTVSQPSSSSQRL
jgi:hypothetical protein